MRVAFEADLGTAATVQWKMCQLSGLLCSTKLTHISKHCLASACLLHWAGIKLMIPWTSILKSQTHAARRDCVL